MPAIVGGGDVHHVAGQRHLSKWAEQAAVGIDSQCVCRERGLPVDCMQAAAAGAERHGHDGATEVQRLQVPPVFESFIDLPRVHLSVSGGGRIDSMAVHRSVGECLAAICCAHETLSSHSRFAASSEVTV